MAHMRKSVKLHQPTPALLPDLHYYTLLVAGELLKLNGRSRFLRLAARCGSAVLSRTENAASASADDEHLPNRIVVPIAYLAVGHAHCMRHNFDDAIENLQKARAQFRTLPDSPLKQYYLGRCLCLLLQSLAWVGSLDQEIETAADAESLLQGFLDALASRVPEKRSLAGIADDVLLKVAHPSGIWYDRCLYDLVEVSTAYLQLGRTSRMNPHFAQVVALLLNAPTRGSADMYDTESAFAHALTFASRTHEALALWRRLLKWENKHRDREEEDDLIRFRVISCLLALNRTAEAKVELGGVDLAHSLMHFSHGTSMLYLARQIHFRLGEYEELLRMCRGYQRICDGKFETTDLVPLMNRYYCARVLKKLERYEEAVAEYKGFLDVLSRTRNLTAGDIPTLAIDAARTLPFLNGDGRRGLAHALRLSGKIDECIFEYRKALRYTRTRHFTDYRARRGTLKSLAHLCETTGDAENAALAYDLLHRLYLRDPLGDTLAVIKYSWYRGKMFQLMGQMEHAHELFCFAGMVCAEKRMAISKTRWPTPEELELVRRTIDDEDGEDEQPVQPVPVAPKLSAGEEPGESSKMAEALPQPSRQHIAQEGSPPREPTQSLPVENSNPSSERPEESTEKDLDFDDQSPFGDQQPLPRLTVQENYLWWHRTIEASKSAAARGQTLEDPAPLDHYDSDVDEDMLVNEEETIASADFAADPVGKRVDEAVEPQFVDLPDTYEEFTRANMEASRYPWRVPAGSTGVP